MAIFADADDFRQDRKPGLAFQETWRAGDQPMLAGVYKCRCGHEWPLRDDEALPGAEHRHQPSQGSAEWRLILITEAPRVVAIPTRARMVAAPARDEALNGRLF